MSLIANILPWLQVILSVLLVMSILLQRSAAGVGGALGGGDGGGMLLSSVGTGTTKSSILILYSPENM
ncbi:MAG TPA: hypothetical protein VIH31_02095 [Candidatus Paceibacterota bacterium]